MKRILHLFVRIIIVFFALIGMGLTAGFFAVKWKLTNVPGMIEPGDRILSARRSIALGSVSEGFRSELLPADLCRLSVISGIYPDNGKAITEALRRGALRETVSEMILAVIGENTADGSEIAGLDMCNDLPSGKDVENVFAWAGTEEWKVFKEAVRKDASLISSVSDKTGVSERLIVGALVGEQMRFFNSDRETFKKFFEPLKILGNETKFSLGVTGIKEETAIAIEKNLRDRMSPFYLGAEYERALDFKTDDPSRERIERLTDKKDRYYPYLYTALFMKQIDSQWLRAGYDVSERPEILGTLWNIGFERSKPKPDPKTGGALIRIGGKEISFGRLVYEFYFSGELIEEFPLR